MNHLRLPVYDHAPQLSQHLQVEATALAADFDRYAGFAQLRKKAFGRADTEYRHAMSAVALGLGEVGHYPFQATELQRIDDVQDVQQWGGMHHLNRDTTRRVDVQGGSALSGAGSKPRRTRGHGERRDATAANTRAFPARVDLRADRVFVASDRECAPRAGAWRARLAATVLAPSWA